MIGRRLPVLSDIWKLNYPTQPGDYCGPLYGYTGDKPAVFFLKPNARDVDAPPEARRIHHVVSPPHLFIEEPDGTLTIRNSIGDMHSGVSDGWHGYLTAGVWSKCSV